MDPIFILVDGIHDPGSDATSEERCQAILDYFHHLKTTVKSFSPFTQYQQSGYIHSGQLRDAAQEILDFLEPDNLDNLVGGCISLKSHQRLMRVNLKKPIFFLAHDLGASIVKQYFVHAPSSHHVQDWENILLPLLRSTQGHAQPQAIELLAGYPTALADIEIQFGIVKPGLQIDEYHLRDSGSQLPSQSSGPWDFHCDNCTVRDILLSIETKLQTRHSRVSSLSPCLKLLSILSPENTSVGRLRPILPTPHTSNWLQNRESFQAWTKEPQFSMMCIVGRSGQGKSDLLASILYTLMKSKSHDSVLMSFCFDSSLLGQRSERAFVISMIRQLVSVAPQLCGKTMHQIAEHSSLSLVRLWAFLHCQLIEVAKSFDIVIAIDQADHCTDLMDAAISRLATMGTTGGGQSIKILTTRANPPEPLGAKTHQLSLTHESWKSVIQNIARERVICITTRRPVWQEFQDSIVDKVCHGEYNLLEIMFHLDLFERTAMPSTKDALPSTLACPPFSLESAFNRLLQPEERFSGQHNMARLALNWVAFVTRPLSPSELAVGVALTIVDCKEVPFANFLRTVSWDIIRDLEGSLGPAIKVVNNRVTFAHPTFRTFVLNPSGKLVIPEFHALITESLLVYLGMVASSDPPIPSYHGDRGTALLDYATELWPHHFREQSSPPAALYTIIESFFETNYTARNLWLKHWNHSRAWPSDFEGRLQPLLLATHLEHSGLIQRHRTSDMAHIEEAMNAAIHIGNIAIFGDLLAWCLESPERGARDATLRRTLARAAKHGCLEMIGALFAIKDWHCPAAEDQGSDWLPDGDPILCATRNGHTACTKALLCRGFSIQAIDASKDSAVHLAARQGDTEALSEMQQSDPDSFQQMLNSSNIDGSTPLQLSCQSGVLKAFHFIITYTRETIKATEGTSPSILSIAAKHGHVEILRELLDSTPLEAALESKREAFELAVENGHCKALTVFFKKWHIVTTLDRLATANSERVEPSDEIINLLHRSLFVAAKHSHMDTTRLLLSALPRLVDVGEDCVVAAAGAGNLEMLSVLKDASHSVFDNAENCNRVFNAAIRNNRIGAVQFLLDANINIRSNGIENSLHLAARLGHVACLRRLLEKATIEDVSSHDVNKHTPLEEAARTGELSCLRAILEWNLRANDPAQIVLRSPKALRLACESRPSPTKPGLVKVLLENDWPADGPRGNQSIPSPLHTAVREEAVDIINLLTKHQVTVDQQNNERQTALWIAAQSGLTTMVLLLLGHAADPTLGDEANFTPLHVAIQEQNEDVVRLLLGIDAVDIEAKTNEGWRPIHYASKSLSMTKLLLCDQSRFLDIDSQTSDGEMTPLCIAGGMNGPEYNDIVRLLLQAGADPNIADENGFNAFHYAFRRAEPLDESVLSSFLQSHAKLDAKDCRDRTPMYVAMRNNQFDAILLLMQDPNFDANIYGGSLHSLIQAAAFAGQLELCKSLVEAKADINAFGGVMGSPLHAAAWSGQEDLIRYLLENGAKYFCSSFGTPLQAFFWGLKDCRVHVEEVLSCMVDFGANVNDQDRNGRTALHLCLALGVDEASVLLAHGAKGDIPDRTGITPVHFAAHLRPGQFSMLLDAGTSVEQYDKCGRSVLYHAALGANESQFREILQRLPEIERKIQLAAALPAVLKQPAGLYPGGIDQCKELFEFILKKDDLDMNIRDPTGWTALDLAECYGAIAIGFLQEAHRLETLVGWDWGAWGYHSDDGSIMHDNVALYYGDQYDIGETVGVALDSCGKKMWFTLDGVLVSSEKIDVTGQLYPAVSFQDNGMASEPRVSINAGPNFKFKPEGGPAYPDPDNSNHDGAEDAKSPKQEHQSGTSDTEC
ncbi:hypothetical protein N7507_010519 [Penicillium longicatenatum]|nr:hypothetical protein N7507_010519 [Penicillium longicatenatum]